MFGNWLDLFEATAADLFVPRSPLSSRVRPGASPKA